MLQADESIEIAEIKVLHLERTLQRAQCVCHNSTKYTVRNAEYPLHRLCGYQEVLWMEHSFYSGKAQMQALG